MAQAAVSPRGRGFSGFLREVADRNGFDDFPELHWLLIENGVKVREKTVERWWKALNEPTPAQRDGVLKAIERAMPDFDAWSSYAQHLRQGFSPPPRGAGGNVIRLRPT